MTPPLESRKTNPIQTQYKPNTNPISRRPEMNVSSVITKDYKNRPLRPLPENKPNSNPIRQKPKMNATVYNKTNYKNAPLRRINPISPPTCPHRSGRGHRHSRAFCPKILVYPSYILQISRLQQDYRAYCLEANYHLQRDRGKTRIQRLNLPKGQIKSCDWLITSCVSHCKHMC